MTDFATTETAPRIGLTDARDVSRFLVPLYPDARAPFAVRGTRVVVGRAGGPAELSVDDPRMSRAHFEIKRARKADVFYVRDLQSKNKTLLDGVPVEREYLRDGALLRSGDSLFAYVERTPPPLSVELPPARSVALAWAEALADRVAADPLPVLVLGPTGAGKELLARRLHEQSGRRGPLVTVNCAGIPRDLFASELFGHVAGAYSGAGGARDGLIRSAQGGTLFLDEVAELALEQQAGLLRALEERRVRPVGADRDVPVDVRVVAATLADLDARVEAGSFRADLRARLAGVTIALPGLARRRGDILPLFRAFLADPAPIEPDAAELLAAHAWPENVRGLKHAARRVRMFAGELGRITAGMLPQEVQYAVRAAASGEPDRETLCALLRQHDGSVGHVARALGVSRQRVYRALEAYAIDPANPR